MNNRDWHYLTRLRAILVAVGVIVCVCMNEAVADGREIVLIANFRLVNVGYPPEKDRRLQYYAQAQLAGHVPIVFQSQVDAIERGVQGQLDAALASGRPGEVVICRFEGLIVTRQMAPDPTQSLTFFLAKRYAVLGTAQVPTLAAATEGGLSFPPTRDNADMSAAVCFMGMTSGTVTSRSRSVTLSAQASTMLAIDALDAAAATTEICITTFPHAIQSGVLSRVIWRDREVSVVLPTSQNITRDGDVDVGDIEGGEMRSFVSESGTVSVGTVRRADILIDARGTVRVRGPIGAYSSVTIRCGGDVIIDSIEGASRVKVECRAGNVTIEKKIDGRSGVWILAPNGFIRVGQKVAGGSSVVFESRKQEWGIEGVIEGATVKSVDQR